MAVKISKCNYGCDEIKVCNIYTWGLKIKGEVYLYFDC